MNNMDNLLKLKYMADWQKNQNLIFTWIIWNYIAISVILGL